MSIVRSSLIVLALALTAKFSVPAAFAQDAVLTPTANDLQYSTPDRLPCFGCAVAITDSVAYVGIPSYQSAPNVRGRVAMYKPNATHTTWQRTGYMDLVSTNGEDSGFGTALAAQSTATTNYMAVASLNKIRIFAKTGSAPWQKMSDYTLNLNSDTSIQSLVWNGDTLAFTYFRIEQGMGSSNVVLLKVTPTYQLQYVQTLPQPSGNEQTWGFGLSIDGDQMAIGAPDGSGNANGYVQLFTRGSNGLWQSSSILAAPNTGAGGFGWGVSLNGNHMVVGAPNEDPDASNGFYRSGAAYVYIRLNGQWTLTQRLRPDVDAPQLVGSFSHFGECLVANSQFAVVVAPLAAWQSGDQSGHLGLYEWLGGRLVLLKWRAPLSGDYLYSLPSISAHYAIVGAPDVPWPQTNESADIVELY